MIKITIEICSQEGDKLATAWRKMHTGLISAIEIEKFLQSVTEAFEFRATDLSLDTRFKEHSAWDSLVSVSTVAMIYAEYDVQVSADELVGCGTLEELKCLVEGKIPPEDE